MITARRCAAGAALPGLLLFLPKCPLCLAAWLTVATGFSFSTTGVAWVRGSILLLWFAAMAAIICRRRPHRTRTL